MYFKVESISLDAIYQVTINGYYNDGTNMVGDKVAFQFDIDTVPHSTKAEFLAAIKLRIEAAQPIISQEEQEKKALAITAKNLLTEYVNSNISLLPPVPTVP